MAAALWRKVVHSSHPVKSLEQTNLPTTERTTRDFAIRTVSFCIMEADAGKTNFTRAQELILCKRTKRRE